MHFSHFWTQQATIQLKPTKIHLRLIYFKNTQQIVADIINKKMHFY